MTTFEDWKTKSDKIAEARKNEIWCSDNGNILCVDSRCMGNRMYSEVTSSMRKKTTSDGGYLLDPQERDYLRDVFIAECGETKPTCECKRLEL